MGKHVGQFVKVMRERKGLSQGDVAKLLRLKTAQSISNIERGVSPLPRAKIKKFAAILGVKKNELMTVVLGEVSDRYSKEVGLSKSAFALGASLSKEDAHLLKSLGERLKSARNPERFEIRKKVERLLQ